MVDSIYIGHIKDFGHLAISGLAVTFPLMNLSAALGTLVGVGAATMISVLLGQKNYSAASKVLTNEVTLNVIIGVAFTALTLLFLSPILRFFGASDNTLPFASDYMIIILAGNVVTHLYFGLNAVIRSSGNPKLAMGLTLFTVISNSILDPIFIFVLDMGIRGAALATVICQMMALSFSMRYFMDQKKFLHLPKKLRGRRLIKAHVTSNSRLTNRFQHTHGTKRINIPCVSRHVKRDAHMALRRQIIDFIRPNVITQLRQPSRVGKIAKMEMQSRITNVWILKKMVDPLRVET